MEIGIRRGSKRNALNARHGQTRHHKARIKNRARKSSRVLQQGAQQGFISCQRSSSKRSTSLVPRIAESRLPETDSILRQKLRPRAILPFPFAVLAHPSHPAFLLLVFPDAFPVLPFLLRTAFRMMRNRLPDERFLLRLHLTTSDDSQVSLWTHRVPSRVHRNQR